MKLKAERLAATSFIVNFNIALVTEFELVENWMLLLILSKERLLHSIVGMYIMYNRDRAILQNIPMFRVRSIRSGENNASIWCICCASECDKIVDKRYRLNARVSCNQSTGQYRKLWSVQWKRCMVAAFFVNKPKNVHPPQLRSITIFIKKEQKT